MSFVRTDHIGRPVFATSASGVKVWSATYTPFGGVHTSTGVVPANRFPGQWFQSESGLHKNWIRDYDPATGRYLEPDPLGLVDGASVFGYVRRSPMMFTDPTGEFIPAIVVIGGVIGAVVGYSETGCWQGAFAGGLIGAATGGGFLGLTSLGVGVLGAGAATGAASAAASQIAANEISGICGCDGDRRHLHDLVSPHDFWLKTLMGGTGGAFGGFAGASPNSGVVQWAETGGYSREVGREIVGGLTGYFVSDPIGVLGSNVPGN